VSVQGEFQRILSELIGFLERTGAPGVDAWTGALREAGSRGRENVSEGARAALALLRGEGAAAPSFESPLEIEEFSRLQEHLTSLCRVILGR
jgi:hypothetical protein